MLPPGVEISISTDYSLFIKDDIEEVKQALLLGIILTAVVTFLFLGSLGTTLNVCLSIPTSLIGTFMAMKWFGFTINFMTLLALSLSVGVVVDDAILVLENIYRRREHGEDRRDGGAARGPRDQLRRHRGDAVDRGHLPPGGVHEGHHRPVLLPVRHHRHAWPCCCRWSSSLTITPMLCSFFLNVRHDAAGRCRRPYGGLLGPVVTLLVAGATGSLDRWVLEPLLHPAR